MNSLLFILTWFSTKKAYLAPYADNESAKKAATKLWNAIDKGDFFLFGIMLLITLIICLLYFFPFNKMPKRHYHPKWWVIFGVITLIIVFAATYFVCTFIAKNASFDSMFLIKVSAMNTFYAVAAYLIISFLINRSGKSNAYPWI